MLHHITVWSWYNSVLFQNKIKIEVFAMTSYIIMYHVPNVPNITMNRQHYFGNDLIISMVQVSWDKTIQPVSFISLY